MSDTRAEVRKVVMDLLANGDLPSPRGLPERVRHILGKGSNTTIHDEITRSWWPEFQKEVAKAMSITGEVSDEGKSLPPEAVSSVWSALIAVRNAALDQANSDLGKYRLEADQKVRAAEAALAQANQAVETMKSELSRTNEKLDAANAVNQELLLEHETTKNAMALLKQELAEANARADATQKLLEDHQESAKGDRIFLLGQIDASRDEAKRHVEHVKRLEKRLDDEATMTNAYRQQIANLSSTNAALQATVDAKENEIQRMMEAKDAEIGRIMDDGRQKAEAYNQEVNTLRAALRHHERETEVAKGMLALCQQELKQNQGR